MKRRALLPALALLFGCSVTGRPIQDGLNGLNEPVTLETENVERSPGDSDPWIERIDPDDVLKLQTLQLGVQQEGDSNLGVGSFEYLQFSFSQAELGSDTPDPSTIAEGVPLWTASHTGQLSVVRVTAQGNTIGGNVVTDVPNNGPGFMRPGGAWIARIPEDAVRVPYINNNAAIDIFRIADPLLRAVARSVHDSVTGIQIVGISIAAVDRHELLILPHDEHDKLPVQPGAGFGFIYRCRVQLPAATAIITIPFTYYLFRDTINSSAFAVDIDPISPPFNDVPWQNDERIGVRVTGPGPADGFVAQQIRNAVVSGIQSTTLPAIAGLPATEFIALGLSTFQKQPIEDSFDVLLRPVDRNRFDHYREVVVGSINVVPQDGPVPTMQAGQPVELVYLQGSAN